MHYIYETSTGNVVGVCTDKAMVENDLASGLAILSPATKVRGPVRHLSVVNGVVTLDSDAYNAEVARAKRDYLLAETDVWSLSDRTMTAAQTTYRQALRDVPSQSGFPNTITWPIKP